MEGQFLLEMFRAEPKVFVFIVYQRSPISSADVSLCHSWNHAHADLDSSFLFSSAAHFKNALQSRFSAQQSSPPVVELEPSDTVIVAEPVLSKPSVETIW